MLNRNVIRILFIVSNLRPDSLPLTYIYPKLVSLLLYKKEVIGECFFVYISQIYKSLSFLSTYKYEFYIKGKERLISSRYIPIEKNRDTRSDV